MTHDPESSEEELKELFAVYGRAYYEGECLHRGLCILYAHHLLSKHQKPSRANADESFDIAFRLTLGQVRAKLKGVLPDPIFEQVTIALEKRNFLAHRFWYEKIHLVKSRSNLRALVKSLEELIHFFDSVDAECNLLLVASSRIFGVTDEALVLAQNEVLAGRDATDLTRRRPAAAKERIVRVWNAPRLGGECLVFESEDGLLLEIGEHGLSRSGFLQPSDTWRVNAKITAWLPAQVRTRPKATIPGKYRLQLRGGACLDIRMDIAASIFKWKLNNKASQEEENDT